MSSLSLPAILIQFAWISAVAATTTSQPAATETLQFRVTGETRLDSEQCEGGRCMNVTQETWLFTVTPAGITATSEIKHEGWDQDNEGNPCRIGGVYSGRHEVTHLNWSQPPNHRWEGQRVPARMLHVRTRHSQVEKGAEVSGNCPEENYMHRPYDVLKESMEQAALDEWFLPIPTGSRTTRSVADDGDTVYTLEVLQGELNDLARYATLRNYITPLTARP